MAKFIFNLAALKKLRAHRLGIAKREYLRMQTLMYNLQDQIGNLKLQRGQTLGEVSEKLNLQPGVNGMAFLISSIADKIRLLEDRIEDLAPDVERHRLWMVEASRDLKAIEILEEKRKKEFMMAENMREKRRIDQWSAENHARKMLESNSEEKSGEL